MNTLTILYHAVYPNLNPLFLITIFFLLTTLVGYAYLSYFYKLKPQVVVASSMIAGVFLYSFTLSILSYFLKGPFGILIITILYSISGILMLLLNRENTFQNYKLFSIKNFLISLICISWFGFIFLIGGNNIYGGDVIAYWGFATSFANGNYPIMSPWQPSILANHHQGIYLYEGAIYALVPVSISLIHTLFSMFIISGGFFLLWGAAAFFTRRTFLSLICSLVFFISFGAIFIPLPSELANYINYDYVHQIDKLPIFTDVKNRLGGSSNLNEIFYINHRVAAFAGMFLLWVLSQMMFKKTLRLQLVFLGILALPIISTDEVVLPSLGLMFLYWLISALRKSREKGKLISLIISGLVFIICFFLVGGALRDSVLTPASESRFQLLFHLDSLKYRLSELRGTILILPVNFMIYLPHLFFYFILAVFSNWLVRKQFSNMLFLGALGSTIAFFLVEHTFYPGNQGRFLHLIYLILSLNIVLNCLILLSRKLFAVKVISVFILLLFVPALLTTGLYLLKQVKADSYTNFNSQMADYKILKWMKQNHPQGKILFLDGYLFDQPYSYLSLNAVQNYGLMVPLSPTGYKVHTPDLGPEYVDVIFTINPLSLKKTGVEYIYITKDHYRNINQKRLIDLRNTHYFKKIFSDSEGDLYEINSSFINQGTYLSPSLYDLLNIIPAGSTLYLDYPNNFDIQLRAALWLLLKDHVKLFIVFGSGGFNLIETPMPYLKAEKGQQYDYLLINKSTNISDISDSEFELIWQLGQMRLYESKK